jgi:hypothetical protein
MITQKWSLEAQGYEHIERLARLFLEYTRRAPNEDSTLDLEHRGTPNHAGS